MYLLNLCQLAVSGSQFSCEIEEEWWGEHVEVTLEGGGGTSSVGLEGCGPPLGGQREREGPRRLRAMLHCCESHSQEAFAKLNSCTCHIWQDHSCG